MNQVKEESKIVMLHKNIYQRINQVMKTVKYVQKGDKNIGLKYSFVSHDSVMAALHDAVTDAGIVILPDVEFYGKEGDGYVMRMKTEFVNMDNPQDKVVMNYTVPSSTRGAIDEKSFGSTYSYACKYALLKTFMLEPGEDADKYEQVQMLSQSQIDKITKVIGEDKERLNKILGFYRAKSLAEIPESEFELIMKRLNQVNK